MVQKLHYIVTFKTASEAIAMERCAKKNGSPGRLIPVPSALKAGCGLCYMVQLADKDTINHLMENQNIAYEEVYEIMI